jgi:hypothetical protein
MVLVWPRPSEYQTVWQAMQDFTGMRTPTTPDEIWLVEHSPSIPWVRRASQNICSILARFPSSKRIGVAR